MIAENRRSRAHIDVPLILLVFALALFGVLCVTVATYSTSSSPDESLLNHIVESSYAMRQVFFLMIAPIIIVFLINFPYSFFKRRAALIYYAATALVTVVWVVNRAEGVKQWLDIIWGFTIQPTEFAKLAMILMLASVLSKSERPMSTIKEFLYIMALVLVPGAVIVFSGEMGSFLVIAFFFAVMLYFSGVSMRTLLLMAGVAAFGLLAIYGYAVASQSDNYRLMRILAFINPEAYATSGAYQQTQSKIAIGSGGLTGIGMFVDGAISQLNYVPADWTDFIFATIGEAWGFVGCIAILAVYFLIILRMLYLARYTRDKFGMLLICGVMGMLLFHVFENIAMTLGLMPITGIPLPFLSYGGSNMVTNMGGVALVLNVTRNRSLTAAVLTPQTRSNSYRLRGGRGTPA